MSKIATKLATLNALRAIEGKAPLAGWKNSEAELDQRIKDLTPGQNIGTKIALEPDRSAVIAALEEAKAKSDVPVTKIETGKSTIKEQKAQDKKDAKAAKKAKAAPAAKPSKAEKTKATAKAKATTADKAKSPTEFGALLTELSIDAKQARATLRRKGFSAPYTDIKAIRAALTSDARKKAK